ncbi:hypothetical protein HUG12_11865 [Halorarum salinum]|uniref:Uncharacterized protein n=1 Tax=Halorarum salinum TaxID=2743089 RepID=A0A7D5LDG7_9EURY|nr:hypothetical protein HUG12_11865 [Halobaculum salinum]
MSELDTERTEVRVKLPRYQKEAWIEDAEEVGMSQAEFVRTMVQAGRNELGLEGSGGAGEDASEEPPSEGVDPRGGGLEDRVLEVLRREGAMDWDELLEFVAGDVEDRLDEALGEVQEGGLVIYSGRDGGYVLTDE